MSNNLPEVDRLAELARLVADRIPALIEDARTHITDAMTATLEDAQEKAEASGAESKPVLALNIAIRWDLNGQTIEIAMPVSVKRKFTASAKFGDPNQEDLPFTAAKEDEE